MIGIEPLDPFTVDQHRAVSDVAGDMAAMDWREIAGLRPGACDGYDIADDVGEIVRSGRYLEGFVAWRYRRAASIPVAVAFAWRDTMPRVANVALFGREGHGRCVPQLYGHVMELAQTFGRRHGIALVQVPVLAEHRAARRMARLTGGVETFDYGPVGRDGGHYVHTIWRLDHGIS